MRNVIIGLSCSLALAACGGSGPPGPDAKPVASVVVSPAQHELPALGTVQLTAQPRDADGVALSGRAVSWTTSAAAVATVSGSGLVTAVSTGAATITATAEGRSGTAAITVAPPTSPAARWEASVVYDAAHQRLLLFGGSRSNATTALLFGDLWTWNGSQWTLLAENGPARDGALVAYDSDRQRLVVWGGRTDAQSGSYSTDTWEWDGTTWVQRATTGPSPRRHFRGAYDEERKRVVLFGGLSPTDDVLRDTWEWDGTTWTQRATTTPSQLSAPSTPVYSTARKALVMLVGGFSSGATELWQWSGASWSIVGSGPTVAMPIAVAATGPDEILMLESNGSATYRWNGQTTSQLAVAAPPARFSGAMSYDRSRHQAVLFGGGSGQQFLADSWIWNGASWVQLP